MLCHQCQAVFSSKRPESLQKAGVLSYAEMMRMLEASSVMAEVEYRQAGEDAIKALLIASDRIHAFFVARFACGRGQYRDGRDNCASLDELAERIELEMAASK